MPREIGIGEYDAAGNACVTFHLCGVRHEPPGLEFQAIIDTGFTGFLQLPLGHAIALGLPLEGTTSVRLADGTTAVKLTAQAQATLFGESRVGVVIIEFGSPEILAGLDFLRQFRRGLIVAQWGVAFMPEEEPPPEPSQEEASPDPPSET